MQSINLTRLTIGSLVILGLVFWTPVAYFAGAMMIFAGLTNICLLERLFARTFGTTTSCSGAPRGNVADAAQANCSAAGQTNQPATETGCEEPKKERISTQRRELISGERSKGMTLGLVLSTNDPETTFNALRLANFSKAQGDEVTVFLLGKGVELDQTRSEQFDVRGQAEALLRTGGRIAACGTCLRLRGMEGSEVCSLSTMKDMYELLKESDRVVSF